MKTLKILIAGDDVSSNQVISNYIQKIEKEIICVKTGKDAIEACQNHPDLDLILMDIRMIGMNGLEATRKIREFNKKVIILAQTDSVLTGAKSMAINAGCNNNISKPIKSEELLKLIQGYFENELQNK